MATQIAIGAPLPPGSLTQASRAENGATTLQEGARLAPLSFAQERIWFLHQLEPDAPVYNVTRALRLRGDVDPELLERAINEIVRRHDVLRTTFDLVDGVPQQVVAPALHIRCDVRDLRDMPGEEREPGAARLASVAAATPFDLQQGPLLRALLVRTGERDQLLVLTMHHIVSEGGWSMNLFLHDLGSLYAAMASGAPLPLPPLSMQYHEYAALQREGLDEERFGKELIYWLEHLRDAPTILELPADRTRGVAPGSRGARTELRLSRRLSEGIRALGRAEGATVSMTLLAAWTALVARYTAQDDLIIGMPVSGRTRLETETMIGLFINTLVLRVDASGDPSFRALLSRVRSVALAAYDHQELPFDRLVKELRPERVGGRMPLVQLLFAPQPPATGALSLPGVEASQAEVDNGTAMADTTLFSWDEPDGIRLVLEYSTELFDAERMRRMLEHYETLLAGAIACPALSLSELPMLTDTERYQLLVEWCSGDRVAGDERCVHELVAEMAQRTPHATAVVVGEERIGYGELNERADLLAGRLRALGVGADVIVGIAVERSIEMVVGLLAILKAGGAYLPLDPAYPAERIAFMIADSGTQILLTQRHLVPCIPDFAGTILELDMEWDGDEVVAPARAHSTDASDLAYVLYTSGSTGRPKGVQISHGALSNLLHAAGDLLRLTRDDAMLAVTTLSFDIAGLEIWLPLVTGARVVVASRATAADGEQLAALLRDTKATIMQATPATWNLLLTAGWRDGVGLKVLCGGEAMPWKLASRLLANGCRVWNMYGPTETTIWSSAHEVKPLRDAASDTAIVSIGRPLANTEVYVLDPHRQLLPTGVPGELYIGGAGLARGYLGRDELTRERFVPHPFSAIPGVRLYRTGDRVRYHSDGTLEFIGRTDHQIKLRGFRIEPGEIEGTLREYPGVRDAVVALHEDGERGPSLVAYLTRRAGSELQIGDVLEHARRRLPPYMVPAALIELDRVPLTPAGKVNRRALPAPTRKDIVAQDRHVAPRNDVEARLVTLWERTIGIEPIGIRDNFFHLGGHSLLVARLFSEMEATFGKRLPLATLFEAPTIEELAAILQGKEQTSQWKSLVPIQEGGSKPPLFLIHGMGGNVVGYGNLVRLLGPDQPCSAFQARGLDGTEAPATTVEEMAASYIAELCAAWPRGPYALCGLSFGGTVAFEMARQLEAAGKSVALVALLDSCPTYAEWTLSENRLRHRTSHTLSVLAYHARSLSSGSPSEMVRYVRGVTRRQIAKVRSIIWRQRLRVRPIRDGAKVTLDIVLRNVEEAARMAYRCYLPRPYPGGVTLFRAEIRGGDEEDLAVGWRRIALGGVEVVDVPGSHHTMMSSAHVAQLAELLRSRLEEAFAPSLNGGDVSERREEAPARSTGSD
jgi:amino acid adenylation domain-containing protein